MSILTIPLFDRMGRPTPFMMAQWRAKGGAQPLQASTSYLDAGKAATPVLRGLWAVAFPLRDFLPLSPLVDSEGRGTVRFWDVFA